MICKTVGETQEKLQEMLAPLGLFVLGWFEVEENKPALLIGNKGSSLWPTFSQSPEYADGQADPMNRWTKTVITPIAKAFDAEMRFPFGEKLWPFQAYAKQAMGIQQSEIGLLIHPEYGLWSAFRAVLVLSQKFDVPVTPQLQHPCESCVEKPCLSTCPIGAFSTDGYDYIQCRAHIKTEVQQTCVTSGCLARLSCPIGQQWAYDKAQQYFHMAVFSGQ